MASCRCRSHSTRRAPSRVGRGRRWLIFAVLFSGGSPLPRDLPTVRVAPADPLPMLRRGVAGLVWRTLAGPRTPRRGRPRCSRLRRVGEEAREPRRRDRRVALPQPLQRLRRGTGRIIAAEGYRFVRPPRDDMSLPVDPHIRPRIQVGRGMSARDYLMALPSARSTAARFVTALADVDALRRRPRRRRRSPSPRSISRHGGVLHARGQLPRSVRPRAAETLHRRRPADIAPDPEPRGQEATALRIGWAYEQASEWKERAAGRELKSAADRLDDRRPGAGCRWAQSFPVPGAMSRECAGFSPRFPVWHLGCSDQGRMSVRTASRAPGGAVAIARHRRSYLSSLAPEPSRRQRLAADLDACGRRRSAEADRGLDAVGHPLDLGPSPDAKGLATVSALSRLARRSCWPARTTTPSPSRR